MESSQNPKNSTGTEMSSIKTKLSTDDRKSKSGSATQPLQRIPLASKGTRMVRISMNDRERESNPQTTKKSDVSTVEIKKISMNSDKKDSDTELRRRQSNVNSRKSHHHHQRSKSKGSMHQGLSESSTIPSYLDPQPKFFVSHLKEDMVVETFDPLAESEEEEEIFVESNESEHDEDFDYESLYTTELEGADDADDFSPAQHKESQSVSKIRRDLEENEEGEEEEVAVVEVPAVEETLSDCDDRSDEEIERDRVMKDLYDKAFADIQATKMSKVMNIEPPSITQKTLDEYFIDREEEKISLYKDEYADWFYTDGSEILYRRKIMACLDSILVTERIKQSKIKKEFKERWEVGQAKQVIVDQALVKFDGYYKETLSKRNRAVRKTAYELNQRILKIHEINRFKKELECLLRLQGECEKRLSRFRIFERYLEKVRDESRGEFSDIRDIIDRYGVLSQARNGLITRDLHNQDTIERAQNSLNRTVQLRSNDLLVYNNYLSELRVYRDNLHEEILQLEEMLLHIKTTAASRTLLIDQIKMAINNLYLGLCKQLGRAGKIPAEDTFRQLNYIKSSMREIIKLNRDVKQMLATAKNLAERDAREKARLEREGTRRKYKYVKAQPKGDDVMAIFGFQTDQS